jgi:thiamine-phosphate pyrophosphorylase
MNLVLISPEGDDARETAMLGELFAAGLERYHVRKPGWSRDKLAAWLRALPGEWRARLVLHQHHDLVAELALGGAHWRQADLPAGRSTVDEAAGDVPSTASPFTSVRSATHPPDGSAIRGITSRSCHDLAALRASLGHFDSVFFGPVFPSISKPGYVPHRNFPFSALSALLAVRGVFERRTRVLALGGVSAQNAPRALALGFDGVAVLGAVWQAADPLGAFRQLRQVVGPTSELPASHA